MYHILLREVTLTITAKDIKDSSSSWDLFGHDGCTLDEVYLCVTREGGELDMEN